MACALACTHFAETDGTCNAFRLQGKTHISLFLMQMLPQGETCQMAKLTHLEELQAPEVKIMVEFGLDERLQLYCRIGYHCTHTRCCFPNYAGTSQIAEAIPPSSIFGPHWVRRQAKPSYLTPAPGFL